MMSDNSRLLKSETVQAVYSTLVNARDSQVVSVGGYVIADVTLYKARMMIPGMSEHQWKAALRTLTKLSIWFPDDEVGGRGILRLPISVD